MTNVRVRFAPSPTGPLHIGGVRTALYNYLFAKKNNGTFILRIEDTDQNRFVKGAEDYIIKSLEWAGMVPDEGPVQGGEYGPYRQSERKELYKKYADQLVKDGKAYYAFDTPEQLEEMRTQLREAKVANQQYNALTRTKMTNSLTLSAEEVQSKIDNGDPYVIRLNVPAKEEIRFKDMIRGYVKVHGGTLEDKILLKSDGMPTYHLANIVDDHLMKITHVIRGEEWLPSTPIHVLLYRYLGWEDSMPEFAHLPLLLKPDGNGKLSKRDADKHGFPIFPLNWTDPIKNEVSLGYKESGYLPDAFINFLSLLGWNPGNDEDLFDINKLIELFDIDRIQKSGAKFDIEKAKWFNQQYLKEKSNEELGANLHDFLKTQNVDCDEAKCIQIASFMKERVTFIHEMYTNSKYLFEKPDSYDDKIVNKKWNNEAAEIIMDFAEKIKAENNDDPQKLKQLLMSVVDEKGIGLGKVMPCIRLALTGQGGGPDLMEIISFFGIKESVDRMVNAVEKLG
ncbi:glutamate--tRNA ligase [Marinigracilibium pacificum]|uniref:Glutamate--tRNA ligase n=1 Tax=Marinigracilibium pacificum TaxID=2729599 RepID=A0A848IUR7_9BACT|nr:glutamate--tRNA ligase [Marinigracilibium pacificum]NMM47035.1 glutamate--tRNA ligase [Marinigracilibium pacificum]